MSKMIFVCSPASDEQKLPATRLMCYFIASHGHVPIAPRLYFPQFTTQADSKMVEAMMSYCDEVWAIGEDQTHAGFQRAKQWCLDNGKQVIMLARTPNICSSNIKKELTSK